MKDLKMKSTCRVTGRPISLFMREPDDEGYISWRRQELWLYTDVPVEEALELWSNNERPLPRDFCWRDTSLGETCRTKIRTENARAQLWACGRHINAFQEEQARVKANREREARNRERERLHEWELERAIAAYDRLKDLGWEAILAPEPPKKRSWGGYTDLTIMAIPMVDFLALVDDSEEEYEEEVDDDEDYETVEGDFFS